jgi:hypothetical protein
VVSLLPLKLPPSQYRRNTLFQFAIMGFQTGSNEK